MRRSALIALLLVVVVMIVLLVLANRASAPEASSSEATQTAWADLNDRVYLLTLEPSMPTPTP